MEKYDKEERLKYLLENKDKIFSIFPEKEMADYIAHDEYGWVFNTKDKDVPDEVIDEQKQSYYIMASDLLNRDYYSEIELFRAFIDIEEKNYNQYNLLLFKSKLENEEYRFWRAKTSWSVKEFMLLRNNINPRYEPKPLDKIVGSYDVFEKILEVENKVKTMKTINFVSEYNKIYELLQDAYSCGNLDLIAIDPKSLNSGFSELRRIKKDDLINWSKENDISLPKEFLEKKSISELEEENQNLKNKIEELQKTKSSGRDKSIDEEKIWDFVINKYFKDYKIDTNRNKTALLDEILEKINESEDIEFEIRTTSLDNIIGKFLKIIPRK
jgi:hypothetical protein